MDWSRHGLLLLLILGLAGSAFAQEKKKTPDLGGAKEVPPKRPADFSSEAVPPGDARPTQTDLSQNYPDLSQLTFGQGGPFNANSGVLRGGPSLIGTPLAAGIVTRRQIAEKQASDMFQALNHEVGVMMQRTAIGQTSPYLRGLTGQQVLILIDGVRLNNSIFRRGPNQYFNAIDPGMVDHIEVLRGSGGVLWGSDAIGGVINVVTRGADVQRGRCCGDYSVQEFHQIYNTADSTSYSRLNFEGWAGRTGLFAGGSFLNVRDLDAGFDFGRQGGTNYQSYSGDVKFNYLISHNQMLTFSLQHVEQENVPRSDRFPGFPGDLNNSNTSSTARFFDPQQRDLAYLRYQALFPTPFIDAITATASYHRQREVQTRGIPTTRTQETDVETVGINIVATKDLGWLGRVTVGSDWYHDDVDSAFSGTASGPIVPDDAFYERIGVFLNWEVQLTCRLSGTAGVRYENIDVGGTPTIAGQAVRISPSYHDFIGYAGLTYELCPGLHLVGSISEGFRAPNLDDLMANNPNVLQQGMSVPSLGLTPETSINYELGVKMNFQRLRTQTFVFWFDIDDQLVSITAANNVFATANQDSIVRGLEHQAEFLLDCGWSVYGNFWYVYGKNKVTGSPLSRIPPAQGILGLRWRDAPSHSYFSIYTWLVRRQDRLDNVRDVIDERIPIGGTPGYGTLNLRMGTSFGCCNQHRLSVSLENITDKAYLVHGSGVFGTGFTARLGYSWIR